MLANCNMMAKFDRSLELADRLETDYLKLLYYDLPPLSSDYKSYENNRLCTILEGHKHISVNSEAKFSYGPRQFILLPPHSTVHMDIDVPTKALVVELSEELLRKVAEKISVDLGADYDRLSKDRFFLGDINNELRVCLNRVADISTAEGRKNKEFLLDLCAQELAYNLVQVKGILQILNLERDNPIHKAISYIQSNIMRQISISQLAYYLNMSETNFCNSFKKIMGITPKEYITNQKMVMAKDMLKNQNVTEVAYDLGYENISHFIALFKNKYGITPKQYQSIGEASVVYKY